MREVPSRIKSNKMKKYKLKELHQKYINEVTGLDLKFGEMPLEEWNLAGYNIQALEEVPSRIELNIVRYIHSDSCNLLRKNNGDDFTDQEKELCEKALNGELLDIDTSVDGVFSKFLDYLITNGCVDLKKPLGSSEVNEFVKQYLNER